MAGIPVPIQYYVGGFSLKMSSVRGIFSEIIDKCDKENVNIVAIALDSQFLEISTVDKRRATDNQQAPERSTGKYSTKKFSKKEQISFF